MGAQDQIDKLANFIMANVEGEPSQSEGAGETAIRIITKLQIDLKEAKRKVDFKRKFDRNNSSPIRSGGGYRAR